VAARMTTREQVEGRIRTAWINGGPLAVTPRSDERYTVEGRLGTRYTVHVIGWEHATCDCKAGLHGTLCWHLMAVLLRRVADAMALQGGQRTSPHSAEAAGS
jgi:uncharacterized Zn finger protein